MSEDLIEDFRARTALPRETIAPRPRRLDLPPIVRRQLARAGIARVSAQAERTMRTRGGDGRCTWHSYRRDRETRTPRSTCGGRRSRSPHPDRDAREVCA